MTESNSLFGQIKRYWMGTSLLSVSYWCFVLTRVSPSEWMNGVPHNTEKYVPLAKRELGLTFVSQV